MFIQLAVIALVVAIVAKYYGATALSQDSKTFAKWCFILAVLSFVGMVVMAIMEYSALAK